MEGAKKKKRKKIIKKEREWNISILQSKNQSGIDQEPPVSSRASQPGTQRTESRAAFPRLQGALAAFCLQWQHRSINTLSNKRGMECSPYALDVLCPKVWRKQSAVGK